MLEGMTDGVTPEYKRGLRADVELLRKGGELWRFLGRMAKSRGVAWCGFESRWEEEAEGKKDGKKDGEGRKTATESGKSERRRERGGRNDLFLYPCRLAMESRRSGSYFLDMQAS
jgi:hypothetical protein